MRSQHKKTSTLHSAIKLISGLQPHNFILFFNYRISSFMNGMSLAFHSFSHNRKLTREKWQMQFLSIQLCLEELKIFSFHAFKFLLYTIVFLRGLYLIPWSFPCQDSPGSLWNKSRHWLAGTTREAVAALGPSLPAGFCCSACKGHLSMA